MSRAGGLLCWQGGVTQAAVLSGLGKSLQRVFSFSSGHTYRFRPGGGGGEGWGERQADPYPIGKKKGKLIAACPVRKLRRRKPRDKLAMGIEAEFYASGDGGFIRHCAGWDVVRECVDGWMNEWG